MPVMARLGLRSTATGTQSVSMTETGGTETPYVASDTHPVATVNSQCVQVSAWTPATFYGREDQQTKFHLYDLSSTRRPVQYYEPACDITNLPNQMIVPDRY